MKSKRAFSPVPTHYQSIALLDVSKKRSATHATRFILQVHPVFKKYTLF